MSVSNGFRHLSRFKRARASAPEESAKRSRSPILAAPLRGQFVRASLFCTSGPLGLYGICFVHESVLRSVAARLAHLKTPLPGRGSLRLGKVFRVLIADTSYALARFDGGGRRRQYT